MAPYRADAPVNRYTAAEMAIAADIPYRSFVYLQTAGLAPKPARKKAGAPRFDTRGLAQISLVGGLFRSGVDLTVAARLAAELFKDFGLIYARRLPSNLESILEGIGDAPDIWDLSNEGGGVDDYLVIRHVRVHASDQYKPNVAMRGDIVVEIIDRRYVCTTLHDLPIRIASPTGELLEAEPRFRVRFERGAKARVISVQDKVNEDDAGSVTTLKQIQDEFLDARRNAIGLLRINASLAIRVGIDRIIDHRRAEIDRLVDRHEGR
jgi:hypothetical protein